MKIIFILLMVSSLLIFFSSTLGSLFNKREPISFSDIFIGFSAIMSVFFIVTHFAVDNQFGSLSYHIWIGYSCILLCLISFTGLRKPKIDWRVIIFIFGYLVFSLILTFRYTLGEQMGDNIYLFQIINKNISIDKLNTFDILTSEPTLQNGIDSKAYISFYLIFSTLYYFLELPTKAIGINYLPPYLLNMWVTNLVFYFFSAGFIIHLLKRSNIKDWLYITVIVLWLGFYTGSIYYNITLPHIVVTYLVLHVSFLLLVLFEYFNSFSRHMLLKIFIVLYALSAFGGTGALYLIVLSFSIIATTLLLKHRDAFLQIPLFLIPILEYSAIMINHEQKWLIIIIVYLIISGISLILYFNKIAYEALLRMFPFLLVIIWMAIFYFSIRTIDNYWDKFSNFFVPQFGADRTQDYFSFSTLGMSLRNVFYYGLIVLLFTNRKTKPIGIVLILIFIFFVNPFMKPFVAENLARYDVYNRIFFTMFNSGSIGLGIYALYRFIEKNFAKYRHLIIGLMIVLMIIPTWKQLTTYYYPSYKPQVEDYNPLYKMGDSQIEILEAVRQVVIIEELDNPRLISQIYGTAMYGLEFVTLGYNVTQQREGPRVIGQQLYEIFYTPAIPGDHRPKINTDLRTTCQLLVDINVDFVIIDKSFSVYDEAVGDYLTIYWYVDRCGGTFVHENDDYIAYRFYRW